jgi:hypothetical protein
MEKVSLTYFVDFVLSSGTPKLTGVREYKERRDELSKDFYRPMREAIVEMHRKGQRFAILDDVAPTQAVERRRRIYPGVAAGYQRFLASRDVRWFEPPQASYQLGDLELNVNPELGLVIDGRPHLVKLHMRCERIASRRAAVMLGLLSAGLASAEHEIAVLDVQRGKLHTAATPDPRIDVLVRGEAAAFMSMFVAV